MKKILALLLISIMALTALVGCGNGSTAKGEVKTGLAVISSIAKSAVKDGKGTAQVDSNVVAVTVDADGKIVKCVIDSVQSKIEFDMGGAITTDLSTTFKTKNELKTEYGMNKNSKIGKEWNEQAASLATYVEGKTVDEVKGISVDEKGYPTGSDLMSSVTMNISGYIAAIEKAVNNAQSLGASAQDKLGVGVVTNIKSSKNATEAGDGKAQAYSNYAVITTDTAGKITSCVIDASQSDVAINSKGEIKSDLAATLKTKCELGAAYNMKSKSGIGKEWNEQAVAFANYVKGKTAAEVEGIAVNDETKPTASDLNTSVTVSIGDFKAAIAKANSYAK